MDSSASSSKPLEPESPQMHAPMPRPGSVTLLAVGVLIITILNFYRLILSILHWKFLASWPGVSPIYIAMTGLIWSMAGAVLLWGLWGAKTWAPGLMQAVALTYACYYWLDHLFLVAHPVSDAAGAAHAFLPVNWPFALVVTVVSLSFVAWTLRRPQVKAYFELVKSNHTPDQATDHI